jgi:fatty acid desaturase
MTESSLDELTAQNVEPFDMGTSGLPGRGVLDIQDVRALSHRSDARGLMRFGAHLAVMTATGFLVWRSMPSPWLLVPAMALHGFTIVTMFAPMHECVHRTAFKSRRLNEIVGWIAGALCFYNFTYYRRYHTWHHRYTQDEERDPELSAPKPRNTRGYLLHISGLPFWYNKPRELVMMATGRMARMPYLAADSRRAVAVSGAAQLGLYLVLLAGSIVARSPVVLFYWFLPALLAEPLLRAILIAEHTGCSLDANGLTNTRTTLTIWPVRLLMWNMPFHAEHHLYPSIPFFRLSHAHDRLRQKLTHLAPSYVAANRDVIQSLGSAEPAST